MNLTLSSLCLCLLFLFIAGLRADPFTACSLVNCGQGTCKPSNATLLPFDCECYPGWKKIQIGSFIYPSCVVPNCTLNFNCDNEISPAPAPLPASLLMPPPTNISDPACGVTWCGDGTCSRNGLGYVCQCNEGSTNLLTKKSLPCFKPCYFGADCYNLGFGSSVPPPPSTPSLPLPPPSPSTTDPTKNGTSPAPRPSPSTSDPTKNGPSEVSNSSRTRLPLTMLLFAAIFLSLFYRF